MAVTRRDFLKLSGLAAVGVAAAAAVGTGIGSVLWSGSRVAYPPAQAGAMHVLHRLTWGPRPQDVDKITALGIEKYIEWQLSPEQIDDSEVDTFLKGRPALSMKLLDLQELAQKDYEGVYDAMVWGRIYRAAHSERQLFELMVEFWTDHFNIHLGDYLPEKVVDDREVIRKHALGRFSDLLHASARSAAMLLYLNNAASEKEHPNENYAREVMELHTLGVDGGYTEADVKEVARAFTGWTVSGEVPGMFMFEETRHDYGEKVVLGQVLPAEQDGMLDGLQVLDILAAHPSTARHISRKLCRRFVSDSPPQALVDSAAQMFVSSGGDIRKVLRHVFSSDGFMSSAGAKFRRPLELVVAMLRATDASLDYPPALYDRLGAMGHLPFNWRPPNGYPDAAGAWMNAAGLLNRWNTAMMLAGADPDGDYSDSSGVHPSLAGIAANAATASELVDEAIRSLLGGSIAAGDRQQLIAYVADGGPPTTPMRGKVREEKLSGLVGLLLSSPYFQWN